jgi:hypothetical protein
MERYIIGLVVGFFVLLMGACVTDCAKATPQTVQVVITDKKHVPAHYREECETRNYGTDEVKIPIRTCRNVWVAPTWSVQYNDPTAGAYWQSVTETIYSRLQLGQETYAQFQKGGVFGIRYSTTFLLNLPQVERTGK